MISTQGRRIKMTPPSPERADHLAHASAQVFSSPAASNQHSVLAQDVVPMISPQSFGSDLGFSEPFGLTGCWLPVRECWNADCSADAFFVPFSSVGQEQSLLMRRPYVDKPMLFC